MKNNKHLKKLVLSAVMSALVFVTTAFFSFPLPAVGYVHLGDCAVLLCGIILGKVYGSVSAGIGSAFADLLMGYAMYIPGTFLIKGFSAFTVYAVLKSVDKTSMHKTFKYILSGSFSVIIVTAGYFLYESLLLGYGFGALAGVVPNVLQGIAGVFLSLFILHVKDKADFR